MNINFNFLPCLSNIKHNEKNTLIYTYFKVHKIGCSNTGEQQMYKWNVLVRTGGSLLPDFDDQLQNNFKLGLNAGLTSTFKLKKYLSLKAKIGFRKKGNLIVMKKNDRFLQALMKL